MASAEVFAHRVAYHGEAAVWWPDGHLRMVDGYAGVLVDVLADGQVVRTRVGAYAACARPRRGGGAVVGLLRGIAVVDPDGTVREGEPLWDDPDIRMNEGSCDPDGNFWCGAMATDGRSGAGTVYRFDAEGRPSVQITGATIPNGLGWSLDGSHAYWNDTPTQTTWKFDYERQTGLTGRRPFVTLDGGDGAPDGLTIDRAGGVWVACWGGGAVRRFDVEGNLDFLVEVGARQVSSCAIGGDSFNQLFITTSRERLSDDDDPLAGSVFYYDLAESLGVPALPFAG